MTIKSVCVYCSSSNKVSDIYKQTAQSVGLTLAKNQKRVVYGGGHVGLMGLVADAALAAGGEVIGIIPEHIKAHEVQHKGLTELHVVDSMHVRKNMMAEKADAFVILPGGFGTLDEMFEILTWKQLALHNKPVIIYNVNGFWDPLIVLINHLIDQHFAPENNRLIYDVVTTPEGLLEALGHIQGKNLGPEEKWEA